MSAFDTTRVDALARRLELSPRQLLVVALRLADADAASHDERRRQAIAQVRAASHASEAVAALLLTPIASFAQDDIDRALENLWPAACCAED